MPDSRETETEIELDLGLQRRRTVPVPPLFSGRPGEPFGICPTCGEAVRLTSRFCPACGQALEAVRDGIAPDAVCPGCGRTIFLDAEHYCPHCGRRLTPDGGTR